MTDLLESASALETLRPEWSALWDRCPAATPFQSPEWLLAWWHAFHPGRLAVAVLRREGRLAGLAPLYVDGRTARPAGVSVSDYLDVLIEPGLAGEAVRHMLECSARAGWDICEWPDLPASSPLLDQASAAATQVCPVAALPAHYGPGLRRNLRRYRERLEQSGQTVFETVPTTACLEDCFRLHRARWHARGGPGVLDSVAVREFHQEAAAGFAARGWLRFYALRHCGAAIAIIYAFACRGRLYLYLGGFDPAFAKYGPSVLLTGYALEEAAREGLTEVDFLRGSERYKYEWGARDRTTYTVRMAMVAGELHFTVAT
jgi:CelD/BcsL family acetyltransferase involved in cellulose biosynthesis